MCKNMGAILLKTDMRQFRRGAVSGTGYVPPDLVMTLSVGPGPKLKGLSIIWQASYSGH